MGFLQIIFFFGDTEDLPKLLKEEVEFVNKLSNTNLYLFAKKYVLTKEGRTDYFFSKESNSKKEIAVMAIKFIIREMFNAQSIEEDIYDVSDADEERTFLRLLNIFFENATLNDGEKKLTKKIINSMPEEQTNDSFLKDLENYKLNMLSYIIKNTNAPRKSGDEDTLEFRETKYTIGSIAEKMGIYREKLSRKLNGKEEFSKEELNLILKLTKTKEEYLSYKKYPKDVEHLLLQWGLILEYYSPKKIDGEEVFLVLEEFIENLTIENLVWFYNMICEHYKNA